MTSVNGWKGTSPARLSDSGNSNQKMVTNTFCRPKAGYQQCSSSWWSYSLIWRGSSETPREFINATLPMSRWNSSSSRSNECHYLELIFIIINTQYKRKDHYEIILQKNRQRISQLPEMLLRTPSTRCRPQQFPHQGSCHRYSIRSSHHTLPCPLSMLSKPPVLSRSGQRYLWQQSEMEALDQSHPQEDWKTSARSYKVIDCLEIR